MRITFVLPAPIRIPMGGPKVIYQHAARFVTMGHTVTVVMPHRTARGWQGWARHLAVQVRDRLHHVEATPYYEAPGVQTSVASVPNDAALPDADVVIATGVQTARWVSDLSRSKGGKAYFIQHLETFIDPRAKATWHCPMALIPCAEWLAREIRAEGLDVAGVVPNAVDSSEFYLEMPIEARPLQVTALYHRHPIKGPDVLIAALRAIKEHLPDVHATVFAARPPSHPLPSWVKVLVRPDVGKLRQIYNRTAVLLQSSRSEGWGLVPMEAAACGAAIVSSANHGVEEYLVRDESVTLAPPGDSAQLATQAIGVLTDPQRRIRLAHNARQQVAQFDLDANSAQFARLLESIAR